MISEITGLKDAKTITFYIKTYMIWEPGSFHFRQFLSCDRCCEDVTGVSYWSDFLLGYYYLFFYHKGSEDVLGFCLELFSISVSTAL